MQLVVEFVVLQQQLLELRRVLVVVVVELAIGMDLVD